MKFTKFIILIAFYNCFVACAETTSTTNNIEKEPTDSTKIEITEHKPITDISNLLYEGVIYEGSIGNKYDIRLKIRSFSAEYISAVYYYLGMQKVIPLSGKYNNGQLNLSYERKGETPEYFKITILEPGVLTGTWSKKDKELPLDLSIICNKTAPVSVSFKEFIARSHQLKLPVKTADFDENSDMFSKEHLFTSNVMNCPSKVEEFSKFQLLDEDSNQNCYYGGYFINKAGNYVLFYFVGGTFYIAILNKAGNLLDKAEVGWIGATSMVFDNFAFEIGKDELFHFHYANYMRGELQRGEFVGGGLNYRKDSNLFDLSGDKIVEVEK